MRELALFAGAGGGILGGVLLGWRTVCAVEINAFCARRLMQRQNEGHLPPFPVWDDVCSFDGRPWRGTVDVVSGGFPCQDISAAGKGAGIDGKRSGLWGQMARIVREVQPRYAFVENSPALTVRGLGRVLGDLAEMGFDAEWGVLSAASFGAWHLRNRLWIVAHTTKSGLEGRDESEAKDVFDVDGPGFQAGVCARYRSGSGQGGQVRKVDEEPAGGSDGTRATWWDVEPGLVRVVHGLANRVDRIRSLGNGQVPAVVAGAWETLK